MKKDDNGEKQDAIVIAALVVVCAVLLGLGVLSCLTVMGR